MNTSQYNTVLRQVSCDIDQVLKQLLDPSSGKTLTKEVIERVLKADPVYERCFRLDALRVIDLKRRLPGDAAAKQELDNILDTLRIELTAKCSAWILKDRMKWDVRASAAVQLGSQGEVRYIVAYKGGKAVCGEDLGVCFEGVLNQSKPVVVKVKEKVIVRPIATPPRGIRPFVAQWPLLRPSTASLPPNPEELERPSTASSMVNTTATRNEHIRRNKQPYLGSSPFLNEKLGSPVAAEQHP